MNRWTRKECSQHIQDLKSPFEGQGRKGSQIPMGRNIAAAIKQHLLKNRVAQ